MRRGWDFLVYGIVVAGILVLTRPGSQGPAFVVALGQALSGFAQAITGSPTTVYAPPRSAPSAPGGGKV